MMTYIEIPQTMLNVLMWTIWMLWGLFLFLYSVSVEAESDAAVAFTGLSFLFVGKIVALLWINERYGIVAVKA